jgi:hypothetical protein
MACDPREGCYALCEEQGLVIWRHSPALCIDLPWAEYVDQPFDEVFHHALKHLMKNIRCNEKEYVGKRKGFPRKDDRRVLAQLHDKPAEMWECCHWPKDMYRAQYSGQDTGMFGIRQVDQG